MGNPRGGGSRYDLCLGHAGAADGLGTRSDLDVARQHGMTTWFGGLRDRDQPLVVDVQLEVTQ